MADWPWVLSIEVAEHIPAEKEAAFISNLHRHNRLGIVISWGVPGQGGHHHVNLRNKEYIIPLFQGLGYSFDEALSMELRAASEIAWLRNTIFVFRKRGGVTIKL